jgi:hypothetical protein
MARDEDLRGQTATLRTALEQTVEAHAAEADQLAALRQVMLQAAEHNLALHRRTLAALDSMTREMERMRRTLKALATARA